MRRPPGIRVKRAEDPPAADDGIRFLVDRNWPRHLRQEAISVDGWLRDLAPSAALWRRFKDRPDRWGEFLTRYFAELDAKRRLWWPLAQAARKERVTLLYSTRDPLHNCAVALRQYLFAKLSSPGFLYRNSAKN
ncbi:hypothetical protein HRbin33_00756 [bacterium HR33]|nr:hypothetical protein HRbin33_00756 [bacterium HR33]